ncbi:hypothetical protein [Mucilaginibacter sp. UYCu711]|uniref:hypothetical protein n=1 Tax=Mucilaginibacter sp. UYCu711 TaxID=3156339 RepID=UPI003D1AFF36
MKKIITCILPALILSANAFSQKLSNKQEISLRAPSTIKIDGKATEWDNKLQAYNKATNVSYTLSNDEKYLYLTIQTKYHDIADKILRGGITLNINHTLQKKDAKQVSITYPVLRGGDMSAVANMYARASTSQPDGIVTPYNDLNTVLGSKDKTINVSGIESITDSSIAIYNDLGIKAASLFDDKLTYTCEIAIPLKYLNLPNNGTDAFSYQIKVNEAEQMHRPTTINSSTPAPPPPMAMTALSTTDFWGEYTLAKK